MFAIAFDLRIENLQKAHPKGKRGVSDAYREIGTVLSKYQFEWVQGSVYVSDQESMTNLFAAIQALKEIPWFPPSVRDLRGFRMENWSDFTPLVKGDSP